MPRLRGSRVCLRSSMPCLRAQATLALRPLAHSVVPSGKSSNHMGSSCRWAPSLSDAALCVFFSLCSRCWKRGLSVAQLRDRKMKLKSIMPGPTRGRNLSDCLRMMKM
jgi:hypothetical protein